MSQPRSPAVQGRATLQRGGQSPATGKVARLWGKESRAITPSGFEGSAMGIAPACDVLILR